MSNRKPKLYSPSGKYSKNKDQTPDKELTDLVACFKKTRAKVRTEEIEQVKVNQLSTLPSLRTGEI